jgi:hypothetical protein
VLHSRTVATEIANRLNDRAELIAKVSCPLEEAQALCVGVHTALPEIQSHLAIQQRRPCKYADDLNAKWFSPLEPLLVHRNCGKLRSQIFVAAVRSRCIPGAKHCTATTCGMDADLTPSTNIVAAGILS